MTKGFGEMFIRSFPCEASLMSRKMTEKPRIANMTCKILEITGMRLASNPYQGVHFEIIITCMKLHKLLCSCIDILFNSLTDLVKDGVDNIQVDDGECGAVEEEEGGQRLAPFVLRDADLSGKFGLIDYTCTRVGHYLGKSSRCIF